MCNRNYILKDEYEILFHQSTIIFPNFLVTSFYVYVIYTHTHTRMCMFLWVSIQIETSNAVSKWTLKDLHLTWDKLKSPNRGRIFNYLKCYKHYISGSDYILISCFSQSAFHIILGLENFLWSDKFGKCCKFYFLIGDSQHILA